MAPPSAQSDPRHRSPAGSRIFSLAGAILLGLAVLAAYHNAFNTPFVFDDIPSITENPSITTLWPLSVPLSPPNTQGYTVSGRPLLNLSLALNHALDGKNVRGYHVFNLSIHFLCALTLFGLVRRSLLTPSRLGGAETRAGMIALAVALLFAVHPLQTEAVTFVVQRAEALMALFFLLTLYGFARSHGPAGGKGWQAVSLAACWLGTGCKEVIVAAPLVTLLYDRAFFSGSFAEAWRRHRLYYAGLFASWIPLSWLVLQAGVDRGGSFALSLPAFWHYWTTQPTAVCTYLKLSLFPHPLCFDYGLQDHHAGMLQVLLIGSLLGLTLWSLRRHPACGFLGAAFFLILLPTSFMPGVNQVIVEHRMYLPLAAVLTLVVCGASVWLKKSLPVAIAVLAAVAATTTIARNRDYQTVSGLWEDTAAKQPTSEIAQCNLGSAWYAQGRLPEALARFDTALSLNPASPRNHYNRGLALMKLERLDEAREEFATVARMQPGHAPSHGMLASLDVRQGKLEEAILEANTALSLQGNHAEFFNTLGLAYAQKGDWPQAIEAFHNATRLQPDYAEAVFNEGMAWLKSGRVQEAQTCLQRSIALDPTQSSPHLNLALLFQNLGRDHEAIEHYRQAIQLSPQKIEARLNLGSLLGASGNLAEAKIQFREVIRLRPNLPSGYLNLGFALSQSGEFDQAAENYRTAIALQPGDAVAHYQLGLVLLRLQHLQEARAEFAQACRLNPQFEAARAMAERLDQNP